MPYIKQEERAVYTEALDMLGNAITKLVSSGAIVESADCQATYSELTQALSNKVLSSISTDPKLRPGHLNYIITSLIHRVYGTKMRYYDYNEVIGVLDPCMLETDPSEEDTTSKTRPEHLQEVLNLLLLGVYGNRTSNAVLIEVIGMLRCCQLEFYRRSVASYEDLCIDKNGDVKSQ